MIVIRAACLAWCTVVVSLVCHLPLLPKDSAIECHPWFRSLACIKREVACQARIRL